MSTIITLYPAFETQEELDDTLLRCAWYFTPALDNIEVVKLWAKPDMRPSGAVPEHFDAEIRTRLPRLLPKLQFGDASAAESELTSGASPATHVLIFWKAIPAEHRSAELTSLVAAFRARGRYYEVDPNLTRMEGSFYLWAASNTLVDHDTVLAQSRARLNDLLASLPENKRKAYVFGTGPSLSGFSATHDFSDGICIVANSMVRNASMLEKMKPVAIVAGDPLFHAGCSRYAGEFRRALIKAMDDTGAWFITPFRDYHIYDAWLPDRLKNRLIGVPFDAKKPYNSDLSRDFYVNPKENVLTLLLFPVAATLADEIGVVGCDGRPLEENDYFWTHDKSAQFSDEMSGIRVAHPAFFNRDYNEYYEKHCETTGLAVATLEAAGKTVHALTPSYVPALRDRHLDPLTKKQGVTEIISIDPDALGNFGHYLSYDARIREVADARGLAFSVFGNRKFDDTGCGSWPNFERVFSKHSWTLGNRQQGGPLLADVEEFKSEFRRTLSLRRQRGITRKALIYMYCGSFWHMEAIADVLPDFPEYNLNINLFWTSFVDYKNANHVARWRPVLERLDTARIAVTAPTERLRRNILTHYGIDIPVAPHPSTTFSDAAAASLPTPSINFAENGPLVLFPGGMRVEKGFALSVDAAMQLSAMGRRCLLRGFVPPVTPRPMLQKLDQAREASLDINSADLSDEDFHHFMATGDIIVLPYLAPAFTERTSGLVVDAMLLGRPIVAIEGTWLADVIREFGVGLVSLPDSRALAATISTIAQDYASFLPPLQKARDDYLASHSWAHLIDSFLAPKLMIVGPSPLPPPEPPSRPDDAPLLMAPARASADERLHEALRSARDRAARVCSRAWAVAKRVRRMRLGLPAAIALTLWLALGFLPEISPWWRAAIWGSAAFAFLLGGMAYVALRFRQFALDTVAINAAMNLALRENRGELQSANAKIEQQATLLNATQRRIVSLVSDGKKAATQSAERAAREIEITEQLANFASGRGQLMERLAHIASDQEQFADQLTSIANDQRKLTEQLSELGDDRRRMTANLDDVSKHVAETALQLTDITSASRKMAKDITNLARTHEQTAKQLDALSERSAQADKFTVFNNAKWYQRFNRRLDDEHIRTLMTRWADDLPIALSQQTLGYLATRACHVEARMRGRLATSIEDILLRTLAAMRGDRREVSILEIGALFGVSAGIMYDALAPHFDNVHITLLDPLDGYYETEKLDVLTGQPISEATLRDNLRQVGLTGDNLTLIKHLSTDAEAIEFARRRQYDVLVIDGDHTYGGVKADFELYAPFVRPGGIIIFDDYGVSDWPDVKTFVDAEVEGLETVERIGLEWRTCVYRVKSPVSAPKKKLPPTNEANQRATRLTSAQPSGS